MATDFTQLLERARRLDRYALEQLHDALYPGVYAYLRFRLEDERACQELAAQVFTDFLGALQRRRPPKGDARAWATRRAGELATRYQAQKQNEPGPAPSKGLLVVGEKAEGGELQATAWDCDWSQRQVQGAIGQMKPGQQHILALRFTSGLSLEQSAETLGKPVRRARKLQWGALKALRRALGEKRPG